jgi:hypothetical protein
VGDDPIISFNSLNKGLVAYYGIFDESADFPKEPYYPVFWKRLVDFLTGKPDLRNLNYKTGKILVLNNDQQVKTPKETLRANSINLKHAGTYTLADRIVVANLLSESESDINYVGKLKEDDKEVFDVKPTTEPFDISLYLIIAGIIVIFFELLYLKFRGDV